MTDKRVFFMDRKHWASDPDGFKRDALDAILESRLNGEDLSFASSLLIPVDKLLRVRWNRAPNAAINGVTVGFVWIVNPSHLKGLKL
jgi:hypothetical protein